MIRQLALGVWGLVLTGGLAAAQPGPGEGPPQPVQPRVVVVPGPGADFTLRLEEDVELLEAQLDTKKAYLKAAEVAASAARERMDFLARAAGGASMRELA